jgi:drug/metabolite transporter (DMT)-like permease
VSPTPARTSGGLDLALFTVLCLVWGSTWLSLKLGVALVPPLTFAAARFLLAALPLLGWAACRGRLGVPAATVAPGAVLMTAVNYGLMSWGIARVPSGVAALVNLSTVPAATLLLAVVHRQAQFSGTAAAALLAGGAGLALLLAPGGDAPGTAGMAAIAAGAACYGWGGVLTKRRPAADPVALAGWQSLAGGIMLAAAAAALEPIDLPALAAPAALAAIGFLALFGSVIGGSIYLALLARWSAPRLASYAFVCPLVALAEGALLTGTPPRPAEIGAALLLLLATGLGLAAQTRRTR